MKSSKIGIYRKIFGKLFGTMVNLPAQSTNSRSIKELKVEVEEHSWKEQNNNKMAELKFAG